MAETVTRISDNLWVVSDDATDRATFVRNELQFLRAQLASLPEPLTNAELLAWAKANYPQSGQEESRRKIKAEIDRLQAQLDAMVG